MSIYGQDVDQSDGNIQTILKMTHWKTCSTEEGEKNLTKVLVGNDKASKLTQTKRHSKI